MSVIFKKTVGYSQSPATGLAPNPLNPLGGLGGEGRASLAPLGPVRGLPPLRTPQMKAGALAPVRPPPGVVSAG